jgi:hypothetical protein
MIIPLIEIMGGIFFAVGTLGGKWTWSKTVLFFVGLECLTTGIMGFVKLQYAASLTYHQLTLINHYRAVLSGLIVGMLVTLLVTGQLSLKRKKSEKQKGGKELVDNQAET